ncbi:MAG: hypothetical protein IH885_05530 [Myxococcales bacterium]|nr:hypothetical protein [Myxococcales bacterium]
MSEQESEQPHTSRAESRGRILDWTEAGLWIVLLVVGSLVALAVLRDSESRNRPRAAAKPAPGGLIEAEDLKVIAKSRDFTFWLQPSSGFPGGNWSKDGHMFASSPTKGDWIDLRLPEQKPGVYALDLFMTKAADYGIIAVYVNEVKLDEFDLLSLREVVPTGALKLGNVELRGRKNVLRLEVVGKNPNAAPPFYQFGIDGIRIRKAGPPANGDKAKRALSNDPKAKPITSESDTERDSTDGGSDTERDSTDGGSGNERDSTDGGSDAERDSTDGG